VQIGDVRAFWEASPWCAAANPYPLGPSDYFAHYGALGEAIESLRFSQADEYDRLAGEKVIEYRQRPNPSAWGEALGVADRHHKSPRERRTLEYTGVTRPPRDAESRHGVFLSYA